MTHKRLEQLRRLVKAVNKTWKSQIPAAGLVGGVLYKLGSPR